MSDDSQRNDAPPDPFLAMEEGTEELDQAALMRRLQADSQHTQPLPKVERAATVPAIATPQHYAFGPPPSDMRDTVQSPAVPQTTVPSPAKPPDPTQHYTVPESLLAQALLPSRRIPTEVRNLPTIPIEAVIRDGESTATFSSAEILEFNAVIDGDGRIALPQSALAARYAPGTRVKVIVVTKED